MSYGGGKKTVLNFSPLVVPLLGTLGVDKGPNADGALVGTLVKQPVARFFAEDYAATTVLTDETTGANSAGANDMHLFPAVPIVNDAAYFSGDADFFGVDVNIGTKAAAFVGTTIWEYRGKTAWKTLTPTLDETAGLVADATGILRLRFVPPTDWTAHKLGAETVARKHLRCRITALTSVGVVPLGTQAWLYDLTHGTGFVFDIVQTITGLRWYAATKSGATADSKFLLINWSKGTWASFALPKATVLGLVPSLSLGVAAADQIGVVQIGEDAVTEFADVTLNLKRIVHG